MYQATFHIDSRADYFANFLLNETKDAWEKEYPTEKGRIGIVKGRLLQPAQTKNIQVSLNGAYVTTAISDGKTLDGSERITPIGEPYDVITFLGDVIVFDITPLAEWRVKVRATLSQEVVLPYFLKLLRKIAEDYPASRTGIGEFIPRLEQELGLIPNEQDSAPRPHAGENIHTYTREQIEGQMRVERELDSMESILNGQDMTLAEIEELERKARNGDTAASARLEQLAKANGYASFSAYSKALFAPFYEALDRALGSHLGIDRLSNNAAYRMLITRDRQIEIKNDPVLGFAMQNLDNLPLIPTIKEIEGRMSKPIELSPTPRAESSQGAPATIEQSAVTWHDANGLPKKPGKGAKREDWYRYKYECDQNGTIRFTHKDLGRELDITEGTARNYYSNWLAENRLHDDEN